MVRVVQSRVLIGACRQDVAYAGAAELRAEGIAVHREQDERDVLAAVRSFRPDLVVLEASVTDRGDGVELGRHVRADRGPSLLFVADDGRRLLTAFDAGADDFMVRPIDCAELVARVRAVLRRADRPAVAVWEVGDLVIDELSHEVTWRDERVPVTPIEFGILSRMARTPGRVISKEQLLADVWHFDAFDVNLVETHVSLLRKKLAPHAPPLIHTVRGFGYVLRPPEPVAAGRRIHAMSR